MAGRKRPPANLTDDDLIRKWLAAHGEMQVDLAYDVRNDLFIAVVVDLSRDRAAVGDGGMSRTVTEAVLLAVEAAAEDLKR